MPTDDDLHRRALDLGEKVARALGVDGRFATHLEFFDTGDQLIVMEVCARAPGAMVSEMARVVSGHNLETAHLAVQAGHPAPTFQPTRNHAAWISLLGRPDQPFLGPPDLRASLTLHHLPTHGLSGRYVAAMGVLTHEDHDALSKDLARCVDHLWYGQP